MITRKLKKHCGSVNFCYFRFFAIPEKNNYIPIDLDKDIDKNQKVAESHLEYFGLAPAATTPAPAPVITIISLVEDFFIIPAVS